LLRPTLHSSTWQCGSNLMLICKKANRKKKYKTEDLNCKWVRGDGRQIWLWVIIKLNKEFTKVFSNTAKLMNTANKVKQKKKHVT
jgi:hypothetical protein